MSIIKLTKDLISKTSVVYRPKFEFTSSSISGSTGLNTISTLGTQRIKKISTDNEIFHRETGQSENADPVELVGVASEAYIEFAQVEEKQIFLQKFDRYDFKVDVKYSENITHNTVNNSPLNSNAVRRGNLAIESVQLQGIPDSDGDGIPDPAILDYQTASLRSWEQKLIYDNLKNVTFPTYQSRYNELHFGFANYNCLNFFTGSSVDSDTCLIYPNRSIGTNGTNGALKSTSTGEYVYTPREMFTLNFWINPRHSVRSIEEYNAGTIFHISSSMAVSLVTGSSKDSFDEIDKFKILLQLSGGSDTLPSSINLSTIDNMSEGTEPIYLSGEHVIKNQWSNVVINWDKFTKFGKISINDSETSFYYPSSSISNTQTLDQPGQNALFLGNYYEGRDVEVSKFFNSNAILRNGIFKEYLNGYEHDSGNQISGGSTEPSGYIFNHPLNSEIHDIRLYDRSLTQQELLKIKNEGGVLDPTFYVPVFFTTNTTKRNMQRSQTETFSTFKGTNFPVNPYFSMGFGGHQINLENFTKEFIHKNIPRLHNLTASDLTHNQNLTNNEHIYNQASQRKRNLSILPCDNGEFIPNYSIIATDMSGPKYESLSRVGFPSSYYNDRRISLSSPFIDMSNHENKNIFSIIENYESNNVEYRTPYVYPHRRLMVSPESNSQTLDIRKGMFVKQGMPVGYLNGSMGDSLFHADNLLHAKIFRESDGTDITMLSFSNLIYGERIHPGSVLIKENNLTGSSGDIKITLKDDGKGSLYRCDSKGNHASWASIGNVLYDEGLIIIKHPSLKYFGEEDYEVSFRGEQTSHVMTINAPAPRDLILYSTNPSYQKLSASSDIDDANNPFVYISGVNVHDEDLNIIMRTTLAQPVVKRRNDELLFKIKMDF